MLRLCKHAQLKGIRLDNGAADQFIKDRGRLPLEQTTVDQIKQLKEDQRKELQDFVYNSFVYGDIDKQAEELCGYVPGLFGITLSRYEAFKYKDDAFNYINNVKCENPFYRKKK